MLDNNYFMRSSTNGDSDSKDAESDDISAVVKGIMTNYYRVFADLLPEYSIYSSGGEVYDGENLDTSYDEPPYTIMEYDTLYQDLCATFLELGLSDGDRTADYSAAENMMAQVSTIYGNNDAIETAKSRIIALYKEYDGEYYASFQYALSLNPDVPNDLFSMCYNIVYTRHFDNNAATQLNVPYVSQEGILPNGCEAVSATMLLRYIGFDTDPCDFVDGYLETENVRRSFGALYGPDPKLVYAGDPRSVRDGIGCFAPVIARALNSYLPSGFTARNTTGTTLSALKQNYVSQGIPVAVWVTIGMEDVKSMVQWRSFDGRETFLYPTNEHCMVFIGYDTENYIFADPYESRGIVSYPIEKCVLAFNSLGMQSVVINGGTEGAAAGKTPSKPK